MRLIGSWMDLTEAQDRFIARVKEGIALRSNQKARRELYKRWREEIGDVAARESAKYVEALLDGRVGWPKFAR